jgi:TPR repeat protein
MRGDEFNVIVHWISDLRSYDKTTYYLQRAVDQGFAPAQWKSGIQLDSGDGISMNKSQGADHLKVAADQGDASAQYDDGVHLLNGDGLPMRQSEGAYFVKLTADQGHINAQILIARLLRKGGVIVMDRSQAVHYFKLAAELRIVFLPVTVSGRINDKQSIISNVWHPKDPWMPTCDMGSTC